MEPNLESTENERVERFMRMRLGEEAWSVDQAKAKLTKIMKQAKGGKPQLVGIRNPVVMIGVDKLKELVMLLQKPETWGEYFATARDGDDGNKAIAFRRYGGRAKYNLDLDNEGASGEKNNRDERDFDIERNLRLVADYIAIGDDEAAQLVIDEALGALNPNAPDAHTKNLRHRSAMRARIENNRKIAGSYRAFLKNHQKGTSVEGVIVGISPKRVLVEIGDKVFGVAYTAEAGQGALIEGNRIKARIVGSTWTEDGVPLSVVDKAITPSANDSNGSKEGAAGG